MLKTSALHIRATQIHTNAHRATHIHTNAHKKTNGPWILNPILRMNIELTF